MLFLYSTVFENQFTAILRELLKDIKFLPIIFIKLFNRKVNYLSCPLA